MTLHLFDALVVVASAGVGPGRTSDTKTFGKGPGLARAQLELC